MTVLDQTSGTLINVLAVLVGSALGLILRGRLPERIVAIMLQAIGLTTLLIGVVNGMELTAVSSPPGMIVGLLALALGGALGEWWRIEEGLDRLGDRLKRRFRGQGRFTEGFVAACLLFCVGPLTLIGSIQNGLTGDMSFLLLKSTLDGLSALALAATFGFGVMFSAGFVLLYQAALSLGAGMFASMIPDPATDPRVMLINGVGGVMIIGLGLSLLDIKRIRTASLLPALPLAVILYQIGLLFY